MLSAMSPSSVATQGLSTRLIELAQVRRRFGYRRQHDLLKPEFPPERERRAELLTR